jgi:hypothetical protein
MSSVIPLNHDQRLRSVEHALDLPALARWRGTWRDEARQPERTSRASSSSIHLANDAHRLQPDELAPLLPTQILTDVLAIAKARPARLLTRFISRYVKLYPDTLACSASVEAFVRAVCELVGSGRQLGIAHDPLRAARLCAASTVHTAPAPPQPTMQALRLIPTAFRTGPYAELFAARDTIAGRVHGVRVPHAALRVHDLKLLEVGTPPAPHAERKPTVAHARAGHAAHAHPLQSRDLREVEPAPGRRRRRPGARRNRLDARHDVR